MLNMMLNEEMRSRVVSRILDPMTFTVLLFLVCCAGLSVFAYAVGWLMAARRRQAETEAAIERLTQASENPDPHGWKSAVNRFRRELRSERSALERQNAHMRSHTTGETKAALEGMMRGNNLRISIIDRHMRSFSTAFGLPMGESVPTKAEPLKNLSRKFEPGDSYPTKTE